MDCVSFATSSSGLTMLRFLGIAGLLENANISEAASSGIAAESRCSFNHAQHSKDIALPINWYLCWVPAFFEWATVVRRILREGGRAGIGQNSSGAESHAVLQGIPNLAGCAVESR